MDYLRKPEWLKIEKGKLGIPCAASGPLVRSSYHAKEDYARLHQCAGQAV